MFPTLYKIDKNQGIRVWSVKTDGNKVISSFGILNGKIQEMIVEATPKNVGKKNETSAEKQALLEAKSLWTRQKRLKYYESIEKAKNPTIFPMLAHDYRKSYKKIPDKVYVQPKLNGVRCLSTLKNGEIKLFSRGGKEYNIPHIKKAMKEVFKGNEGYYFDGEIYLHGQTLQEINRRVKKYRPGETEKLEYWIYDFYDPKNPDKPFSKRNRIVYNQNLNYPLAYVQTDLEDKNNLKNLLEEYTETINSNDPPYEGIIIRNPEGIYSPGQRSYNLQKLKPYYDAEYKVIGYTHGKGSYSDCVIWICETENGSTFNVNPKCSIEEKKQFLISAEKYVGKYLTVQFNGKTEDGKPEFPVGLCFRIEEDLDNEESKTNMRIKK